MSPAPIRVGYDVTATLSGRTGIARYVEELSRHLEQPGSERAIELRRFAVGRGSLEPAPGTRRLTIPARVMARWWRLSGEPYGERLAGGADVIHATGLLVPPTRGPLVVTVHDLAALTHPGLHSRQQVAQARALLPRLQRAGAVLAVSRTTAEHLSDLGVEPARIVVSRLGSTRLPEPTFIDGLEGRFVLTVGETAPRKGYEVVLRAMARLDPATRLVMAGPPAADEDKLASLADELGVAKRVIRLGHVSEAQLSGLYARAEALCFPSLAEGFGLPVLEAMTAGTPVIARDIPAVRELAGDAAVMLGPDPDAWAQAIEVSGRHRSASEPMIAAGCRRAARLTWQETARTTLAAYRLAMAAGA